MAVSEELIIQIKAEVDKAVSDLKKIEKQTKNIEVVGIAAFVNLGKQAFAMGQKIFAVVGQIVDAYKKQEMAEIKLATTLKSTGNVVGYTTGELKKMASGLQDVGVLGDEAIIEAQAMLLTFKQIGHDTFPRATEAAADMALMFGGGAGGLQSATIMLGKALNDPIQGLTALRRVGIQLTESQEEMVKGFVEANDIASAQAIILGEVESQFGGLNRAMGESAVGKIDQFSNAVGDLVEVLGEFMTESIAPILDEFKPFIEDLSSIVKWLSSMSKNTKDANKETEKQTMWFSNLNPLFAIAEASLRGVWKVTTEHAKAQNELNEEVETGTSLLDDYVKKLQEQVKVWTGQDEGSLKKKAEIAEKRAKIDEEYTDKYFKLTHSEIEVLQEKMKEEIRLAEEVGANTYLIRKYYNTEIQKLLDKEAEKKEEADKEELERLEEERTKIEELAQAYVGMGQTGVQGYRDIDESAKKVKLTTEKIIEGIKEMGDIFMEVTSMMFDVINMYYDNEIARIENSELSEEEKAEAIKKIKRDQFNAEKAFNITESIINTATAVTKALAAAFPPLNFVLAGIVAAAGAAQTAMIASQPMPAFARGGSFQTSGPQAIIVGDNPSGMENVNITPAENAGGGGVMVAELNGEVLVRFIQSKIDDGSIRTLRAS